MTNTKLIEGKIKTNVKDNTSCTKAAPPKGVVNKKAALLLSVAFVLTEPNFYNEVKRNGDLTY